MSLYRRGNVWWSRIELDGIAYQFSTKKTNKNEARRVEAEKRNELAKGIGTVPTLEIFSIRFVSSLPARVSKDTLKFYVAHLQPLLSFAPLAGCRLDRINAALIEDFVQHRRNHLPKPKRRKPPQPHNGPLVAKVPPANAKTISVTTINHNLRTLRRVLHLAQEWEVIARAPKVKLLKGENQREYVLADEIIEKFIQDGGPIGEIIPLLCDTGLRRGELCNLTWDAVSLPLHSIEVRKGKTAASRRKIPLTRRAERILTEALALQRLIGEDATHVFTVNGHPMTRDWLSHAFQRARKRLRLPAECVLHSTRHTFCTRLGERGADAFAIQRLAGHSSIVISQRYVHAQGPRVNTAIRLLEPEGLENAG
ncbi:MAG: tyrosine-type recombinase/integrase [Terriglobales bacterium]